MDIAFVTTYDARNVSNWSGLGYYISKSLENDGNSLQYIGDLQRNVTLFNFIKKAFYSKALGKRFFLEKTVAMAKGYSDFVASKLFNSKYDCVFSPGSIPIAFLKTDRPKVFFTDATFASILNYYEPSDVYSKDIISQAHEVEKQSLDSCALAIYSSDWAAQSAVDYYGINPAKIKVVPFGANFDEERKDYQVENFIQQKDNKTLKILFNGVNFLRKGGDLVLSAVKEIQRRGIPVELHFVGLPVLPIDNIPDFVINHGFLKKSVPAQKELLEELYQTCHFLFLPSRAEAFGCVFCEASSFGMPSISRKTGGVQTAIKDGLNGFTLDSSSTVNDYADLICAYFADKEKYIELSRSSFEEYRSRLNWKVTGQSITTLIKQL